MLLLCVSAHALPKKRVAVASLDRGSAGRPPTRKATLQARPGQQRTGWGPGMFLVQPSAETFCATAKCIFQIFDFLISLEPESANTRMDTNMGGEE